ncbi:hypothetical protein HanRHA438_Chr08g0329101 [Helianthus annuus]|nr:hypothetical protein HanRHA438_Chr08g0329101 [Helianthus annuus]
MRNAVDLARLTGVPLINFRFFTRVIDSGYDCVYGYAIKTLNLLVSKHLILMVNCDAAGSNRFRVLNTLDAVQFMNCGLELAANWNTNLRSNTIWGGLYFHISWGLWWKL